MKKTMILAPLLFFACVLGASQKMTEARKIAGLLEGIRGMQGAIFIRNGKEYPPGEAADHLAMKYAKAGDRIRTARQFIDFIASKSYLSGKEYMIKLPGGRLIRSRDILLRMLREIESGPTGPAVR
ncbi:MAG: hypothetical protein E4G96_01495 [Chrysiogenales bacterium]|nr:MAG: hypothetical protein E4G96_01495 [Chrysiogenales bacterium]